MSSIRNFTTLSSSSHVSNNSDDIHNQFNRGGITYCSVNEKMVGAPKQTRRNQSEPLEFFIREPPFTFPSGARSNDVADMVRRTYGGYLCVLGKVIPATQEATVDLRHRLMPNGLLKGETEYSTRIKLIEMFESLRARMKSGRVQGPLHHWDLFNIDLDNSSILAVVISLQQSTSNIAKDAVTADFRGMLPYLQNMKLIPEMTHKKNERYSAIFKPPPQILQNPHRFGVKRSREDWSQLTELRRQMKVCGDVGGITDNLVSMAVEHSNPSRSVGASALIGVFLNTVLREWLVVQSRQSPMPLEFLFDNYPRTNLLSQRPVHKPFPLMAADFKRFAESLGNSIVTTQKVMMREKQPPGSDRVKSIWDVCNQPVESNIIYIGIPWSLLDDLARSTLKLESTYRTVTTPPHPQNDEGPWGEARRLAHSLGRDDPHVAFPKAFPDDALALAQLVATKNSKAGNFVLVACSEIYLSADELNFRGWKPTNEILSRSCCISFKILSIGNVGKSTSGWQVFGVPLPNCILVTHGTSSRSKGETTCRRQLLATSCFPERTPFIDLNTSDADEMVCEGACAFVNEECEGACALIKCKNLPSTQSLGEEQSPLARAKPPAPSKRRPWPKT